MAFERVNENDNKETPESRRAEAEKKIEDYNKQMDDNVKAHGEMLKNRRDLSPEEKNEMQAEITENAKIAKAEYREYIEEQYPELQENEDSKESEQTIEEEQSKIGDEL